jgi:hypothetical protein
VEPLQERWEYFPPPILPQNQIRRSAASWIKIWTKVRCFSEIVFKWAEFKTKWLVIWGFGDLLNQSLASVFSGRQDENLA